MDNPISAPSYDKFEFSQKKNKYCICVFVINEGEKLLKQLKRMAPYADKVDIVVADGGSTDGSVDHGILKAEGVNALLVKTEEGKLGTQMRMAFAWALERNYSGVITIDGNGKDGVEAIPDFIEKLDADFDYIQGSRFIAGGHQENTPRSRIIGLKLLHAPLISLAAGFKYTDTTNGFRAYSKKLLQDEGVSVFRDIFKSYELHYYLAVQAAKKGFKVIEIPVSRCYPSKGALPSKISPIKGNADVLARLFLVVLGYYSPPKRYPS